MKRRMIWTGLIVMLLSTVIGLGSREYGSYLPKFVVNYTGDVMWALAFFALFRLVLHKQRLLLTALVTLGFSLLIELSQFWHPQWLDKIRNTWAGGLLLGFGFLWSDLLCYLVGCLMGLIIFSWAERGTP